MTDLDYMQMALSEAKEAFRREEVPVGAVIVGTGGTVLSRRHNETIIGNDPTAHAEVLAIREAAAAVGNYRLTGTTLYVTVEPCLMCVGAIVWARIGRLVYGTDDLRTGAVQSLYRVPEDRRLNHRPEVLTGVLKEPCREIMQDFFRSKRDREKR